MATGGTVIAAIPAGAATDLARNGNTASTSSDNTITFILDTTPPVITPTVSGTMGSNGWYVSNVTVSWSVVDNESAITSQTGCGSTTISADTVGTTLTCSASSAGGTSSQSVTMKRDATPPTLSPTVAPNPVLLGGSATASPNASDATSGVASATCGVPATTSVGSQSVSCAATDHAGNTRSANAAYDVYYGFSGLQDPYAPPAKRAFRVGSTIPLSWQYTDASGAVVPSASAAPTVEITGPGPCLTTGGELITVDAAGNLGLQYDTATHTWQFNWRTSELAAGCYAINIVSGQSGQSDGPFPIELR